MILEVKILEGQIRQSKTISPFHLNLSRRLKPRMQPVTEVEMEEQATEIEMEEEVTEEEAMEEEAMEEILFQTQIHRV